MLTAEMHRGNREASGQESYGRFLYNLHRYYDPATGRYLTADPSGIGHGMMAVSTSPNPLARGIQTSLYPYAGGNPANAIDRTGLYYCVYAIGTHTLSCWPNNPTNPDFPPDSDWVSGSTINPKNCADCRDNENRIDVKDAGPLPTGYYNIGAPLAGRRPPRRALTPDPGYSHKSYNRTDFQFHFCPNPHRCSQGCIATPDLDLLRRLNNLLSLEEGNNQLTVLP